MPNFGIGICVLGMCALYALQIIIMFALIVKSFKETFFNTTLKDKLIFVVFFPIMLLLAMPILGTLGCVILYTEKFANINKKIKKVSDGYILVCCAAILWGFILGLILCLF